MCNATVGIHGEAYAKELITVALMFRCLWMRCILVGRCPRGARCLRRARCLLGALIALPRRHRIRTTPGTSYSHYPGDIVVALPRIHLALGALPRRYQVVVCDELAPASFAQMFLLTLSVFAILISFTSSHILNKLGELTGLPSFSYKAFFPTLPLPYPHPPTPSRV